MDKMTTNDTVLWINHAVSFFKSINKNQKDLAKILGLEESRISEMKQGIGTITPNIISMITDLCGAPRRNPGRYAEVELYNDIDAFEESFNNVTINRFYRKLINLLQDHDFYNQFLDLISAPKLHYQRDKIEIEALLNQLISTDEYHEICEGYLTSITSNQEKTWWANLCGTNQHGWSTGGLLIRDLQIFKLLLLFSKFSKSVEGFKFGEITRLNLPPEVEISPVILTGNRILIMESGTLSGFNTDACIKDSLGLDKTFFQINHRHQSQLNQELYVPENWENGRCEVYLSENMNYHFLIHLSPKGILIGTNSRDDNPKDEEYFGFVEPFDRLIVIRNVNALNLCQQIEKIRKWFGLATDSLFELKQEIARAGGYVPGARVLL
jgi:hypothetical protein